jgi:hypothetical protein
MRRVFHLAASTAVLAVFTLSVTAQVPLSKESPFLPLGGSTDAPSEGKEMLALTGVSGSGKTAQVCIVNTQNKHVYWIPVGTTIEGIKVLSYDLARDQAVISLGGKERVLTLRSSAVANAGATPGTVNNGFATPAPASVGASLPTPTQGTPQPPPVPGSIAHQETEARMLVSDLLEIGMQQRKAYEEAQKKAEEEKKKS